mgnify:CR=1 FL=1
MVNFKNTKVRAKEIFDSFSEDILENRNILELTRLFIHDGYGKNIESLALGLTFKWMKENAKGIKVLISYADPEQSHDGAIYQATNWNYLGFRISDIMFEGTDEQLKQTNVTQPAIFIHSVIAYLTQPAETSVAPDMVAGHSLGEYSALVYAGALSDIDAFKLVRKRGEAMLQSGIEQEGTMGAILGLSSGDKEPRERRISVINPFLPKYLRRRHAQTV